MDRVQYVCLTADSTLFYLCRRYWLYWRKKTTNLPYVSLKHHHIKWWLFQ